MGLFSSSRSTNAPTFEVWGQRGWANVEVVGESHYARELQAVLPKSIPEGGAEATVPVTVVHDSRNKYDSHAVEIRAASGVIGFLAREDAKRYAPMLDAIQAEGLTAATTARVWGSNQKDWETGRNRFFGSVRVDLPEPHMLRPANEAPGIPHQILPSGNAIQVTGEENHRDATSRYLTPQGECWVHATLHQAVDDSGRTPKPFVEVKIDGKTVGRLTPKMSGDLAPAIQFLHERGQTCAVHAIVKGNQLKADVVLYAKRAHELDQAWFDALPLVTASPTSAEAIEDHKIGSAAEDAASMLPPPLPPADWYADPHGIARLRYWDGQAWTDHTAD
jgi:collagen type III alpha